PAVRGDDPLGDEEAEAQATRASYGVTVGEAVEGLEDPRQGVRGYRRTVVSHLEDRVARDAPHADVAASPAVGDRVPDQIRYDLREAIGIPRTMNRFVAVHGDVGARIRGAQLV